MNLYKQRVLNVARALRESPDPDKFYMGDVIHNCGTPACAFGHYVCRTDLQDSFVPRQHSIVRGWGAYWKDSGAYALYFAEETRLHFGLDLEEHHKIFAGGGCGGAKTATDAAMFIELFAENKWPDALRPTSAMVADLMARMSGKHIQESKRIDRLLASGKHEYVDCPKSGCPDCIGWKEPS
jgi:hypothetical protein